MTVTFTLTGGSSSTNAGPFNISGTTSGGASNTVLIATGITKTQLLTGHTVTNVTPENITGGTITSTGTCTTTTTWSVVPTPTPTPTATAVGCECYTVYNEADRSIIFQYNRCSDGTLVSLSVPLGANRSICVQNGGDVIDTSGLLTVVSCGLSCTTNADCTVPCI